MYDLTAMLTTITACSATIVAIIGGFIASKLISLSTERSEVTSKLSEVEEEISFRQKELTKTQSEIDEDDALDFIINNIDALIEEKSLDDVYKKANQPLISKVVLLPYWNQAVSVLEKIYEDSKNDNGSNYELNDEDIPISLLKQLSGGFEYDVCKEIIEYFDKLNSSTQFLINSPMSKTLKKIRIWYLKAKERIAENKSKINWLQIQRQQLLIRKDALKKPKGMASGIFIFIMFSISNIILPLLFTPFMSSNIIYYWQVKYGFIVLFSISLIVVMLYLIYLLKWKETTRKQTKT